MRVRIRQRSQRTTFKTQDLDFENHRLYFIIYRQKFSNGEKDEQVFDAISVGSWLKVRGSIQEDTFVRDLVMNAQDIIEVKHTPRKDYAPEGENE